MSLLEVRDLTLSYPDTPVFEGLSFSVERGEVVGLIGPSGSGKSSCAQAILRLPLRQASLSGQILFEGEDLLSKSEKEMRPIRGRKIGMIFQDPASSLNPTMKIGPQIAEGMIAHRLFSRKGAKERTFELLSAVQLPPLLYHFYPHQLSGGMRQRVMIAIALASSPSLLIADEPTSALDASTTGEILSLLKNLQKKLEMGLLLITHDPLLIDGFAHRSLQLNEGELAHAP